jgi:hypothetical protein
MRASLTAAESRNVTETSLRSFCWIVTAGAATEVFAFAFAGAGFDAGFAAFAALRVGDVFFIGNQCKASCLGCHDLFFNSDNFFLTDLLDKNLED